MEVFLTKKKQQDSFFSKVYALIEWETLGFEIVLWLLSM